MDKDEKDIVAVIEQIDLLLSGDEIWVMTNWPDAMIDDYMATKKALSLIVIALEPHYGPDLLTGWDFTVDWNVLPVISQLQADRFFAFATPTRGGVVTASAMMTLGKTYELTIVSNIGGPPGFGGVYQADFDGANRVAIENNGVVEFEAIREYISVTINNGWVIVTQLELRKWIL